MPLAVQSLLGCMPCSTAVISMLKLVLCFCPPHADSQGKLPHEVEAEATVAAQAAAAEAEATATAAALHGIPTAHATWEEVAVLMKAARADMARGSLSGWLANGKQRAKAVDARCGAWLHVAAHTQEQKKLLSDFWLDFKAVCEK